MARLNAFKVDSQAIEAGQWVSPGDEYDDLQLLCRGYTDVYYDAQAQKMRRAATAYGGDLAKVPNSIQRDIRIDCLIRHIVLDVKGLADENGKAVDFARFCDLLRNPDYGQLVVATMTAASMVGRQIAQDKADASGNSATPSA
jgi:hypothetical protein